MLRVHAGDNIEELFSRVAVVAFENILMKEVEAASSPPPSNGQLSNNSTLIRKSYDIQRFSGVIVAYTIMLCIAVYGPFKFLQCSRIVHMYTTEIVFWDH